MSNTNTARRMTRTDWIRWVDFQRLCNWNTLSLVTLQRMARRTIGHARGLASAVSS